MSGKLLCTQIKSINEFDRLHFFVQSPSFSDVCRITGSFPETFHDMVERAFDRARFPDKRLPISRIDGFSNNIALFPRNQFYSILSSPLSYNFCILLRVNVQMHLCLSKAK
jgi:hypothetical protein